MKRVITIIMAIAMIAVMSISVFATGNGFISSPSKQKAPQIVVSVGENENGEVEVGLVITAYGDRDELNEEGRQIMEEAYATIMRTPKIVELNTEVKEIIERIIVALDNKIKAENLAVSDFFDITDVNVNEANNYFIEIKPEALENFVCLLHYYDGDWHVVENAKVSDDGEHLEFSVDGLSPFAIVVDTGLVIDDPVDDPVDDPTVNSNGWIVATGVIVAGVILLVIAIVSVIKRKKNKI